MAHRLRRTLTLRSRLVGVAATALALGVGVSIPNTLAAGAAAPVTAHTTARPLATWRSPHALLSHATGESTTFVVNTTTDSGLLNSAGTTCVDSEAIAHCSLRAAIDAANNLAKPVEIKLSATVYDLTLGTLIVSNPRTTTIVGVSSADTVISDPSHTFGLIELVDNGGLEPSTLSLDDLRLTGGDATEGGAVDLYESNDALVLTDVVVTGNDASYGGGIYLDNATMWAYSSNISSNAASTGGAIDDYWSNIYLSGTTVNSNDASAGGAIYNEYGQLVAHDSTFDDDLATDGGVVEDTYGSTNLTGSTLSHDTADFGGALYEDVSAASLTDCTLDYDVADGTGDSSGGGLFISSGTNVTIDGGSFEHDSTSTTTYPDGGGAIDDSLDASGYSGTLSVTGALFFGNTTSAVLLNSYDSSYYDSSVLATFTSDTFTSNSADSDTYGGALTVIASEAYSNPFDITLSGDTFTTNHATGEEVGGAIGTYVYYYSSVDIHGSGDTFSHNTGSGPASAGAVNSYVEYYSTEELSFAGSTFVSNSASAGGTGGAVGAVNDDDKSGLSESFTNDLFQSNVATASSTGGGGDGGAICFAEDSTEIVTGDKFVGNEAVSNDGSTAEGGAIADYSYHGVLYTDDTFQANKALGSYAEGGAVWLEPEAGGAIVDNSTFTSNTAVFGGALYVDDYTLTVENSTLSSNVAGSSAVTGYGGAIYTDYTLMTVMNSTLTGNEAITAHGLASYGGAIYSTNESATADPDDDNPNVEIQFSTITGNAAYHGGGVAVVDDSYGTVHGSILGANHQTLTSKTLSDCATTTLSESLASLGGNVLTTAGCVAGLTVGDAVVSQLALGLAKLANNGGPTETMALSTKSPAVKAVHGDCVPTDQRGVARPAVCDAGSYELTK